MWPFQEDPYKAILKRHIDSDFSVFAVGNDRPNNAEISAFESEFCVQLPKDFREFSLSALGGIYVEAKESVWPHPKQFQVAAFWTFLNGVFAFGFSPKAPEFMSIRQQTTEFRSQTGSLMVPCLKILSNADIYCFSPDGKMHRWDHETEEFNPIAKSFAQLLDDELGELRKRKDRKKSGQS